MKYDTWAQRLVASAIVIASIALLVGTFAFAYTEVASLPSVKAVVTNKSR
jgi:hypothetical protein